jgi:hypothetical protein
MIVSSLRDYICDAVGAKIKELSGDPKYTSKEIERLMHEAIKEQYPKDYDTFVESHRGELRIIKEKLISQYGGKEIQKRISELIG